MNNIDSYHRFFALLKKIPFIGDRDELKKEIVAQYTNQRTVHLHEMTDEEYRHCCDEIDAMLKPKEWEVYVMERKKHRSRALHQLQLYGIDTTDWDRVNEFCKQSRIAGMEFRDMDIEELDALTVKMRTINRKKRRDGVPPNKTEGLFRGTKKV